MMGENTRQLRSDITRDFLRVKQDIEALNIRIMLLESENKRLREELFKKENEELKRKISEKTEASQKSLSLSKLRIMMEEILGKTLKEQNTNASRVFSAETQSEFAPIFPELNRTSVGSQQSKMVGAKNEFLSSEGAEHLSERRQRYQEARERYEEEHNEFEERPHIRKEAAIKKDSLKSDLLKSYQRNRKNIIKQQILGEIHKGEHTKIALRDLIVEQKKYCSKASFYRYIEELELENLIGQGRRKGKNIIVAHQAILMNSPREEPSLSTENER